MQAGAPLRPWLYRIATNVALDTIGRDRKRTAIAGGDLPAGDAVHASGEITWLQPLPDGLLEEVASPEEGPDEAMVRKETVELAFLTVIQLLTPRQRAVLLLRDVLGWSAKEAAELLEVSAAAANSALQRARETLRKHLPVRRPEWPVGTDAAAAEKELIRRYVAASEEGDPAAFEALIREDAVFRMPPEEGVTVGRDAMINFWKEGGFGTEALPPLRCVVTRANGQPAVACYIRRGPGGDLLPLAVDVLRIEEGLIAEIITFGGDVFPSLGLPERLEGDAQG